MSGYFLGYMFLLLLLMVAATRIPEEKCPDCGLGWQIHWPDCPRHKKGRK